MLIQLDINNIALIKDETLELDNGLNVLTGETGAGKSIIVECIGMILGERVSKDLIRRDCDKASVDAVFVLDNEEYKDIYKASGIEAEEDGTLIISREITTSGRNICRINNKLSTVSAIRSIVGQIIDIHGQFDSQILLKPDNHVELLDSFGGLEISKLKDSYGVYLTEYKEILSKIMKNSIDQIEREKRIDILKYQIEEIKKANLKEGEYEDLKREKLIQGNCEKIITTFSSSYELLFSGNNIRLSAIDTINQAISEMKEISNIDSRYEKMCNRLEEVSLNLEDIIELIRGEKESIEFNPALLEEIEDRIDLINNIKKKYGETVSEVINYLNEIEDELYKLEQYDKINEEYNTEILKKEKMLYETAVKINTKRNEAANVLQTKVEKELDELEMKKSKFKVLIEFDKSFDEKAKRQFLSNGLDRVEFLISPNVGEDLKSLNKIASGGEMSRIMLAIKTILADVYKIPVLVFDEIDMGISGKTAHKVGEKLFGLSKKHQVICVTHHAQIASMADSHYIVEKRTKDDETLINVNKAEHDKHVEEIARILGGAKITELTMKHAEEMIELTSAIKKS